MPITRTYQCSECFHRIEVVLPFDKWDDPPPNCPRCVAWTFEHQMQQEFKPIAVKGVEANHRANAQKLAETIAHEDYGVADFHAEARQGGTPKVRFKDQGNVLQQAQVSTWGATGDMLAKAMQAGRQTRREGGDGLDILQGALKSGAQPDLIAQSKKRMMRVY